MRRCNGIVSTRPRWSMTSSTNRKCTILWLRRLATGNMRKTFFEGWTWFLRYARGDSSTDKPTNTLIAILRGLRLPAGGGEQQLVCIASAWNWIWDRETFHIPPLMRKRTICIRYERWWQRRRDWHLRRGDRVAVEQKYDTDSSGENGAFMSWSTALIRIVNGMQLCCCLTSKFIDILKWYPSLQLACNSSARGIRVVSTRRTTEMYETSHCRIRPFQRTTQTQQRSSETTAK